MVLKNLFFAGILKVNDENSRIRIHPKMSWIRNTAVNRDEFTLLSYSGKVFYFLFWLSQISTELVLQFG